MRNLTECWKFHAIVYVNCFCARHLKISQTGKRELKMNRLLRGGLELCAKKQIGYKFMDLYLIATMCVAYLFVCLGFN